MEFFERNIPVLYLYQFLTHLMFISAVLIPFYLIWAKISLFQVMLLQSWFMFWRFALEVPTGTIADWLGRKTSLSLAAISTTIAALVYASYPHFYVLMLGEFLFALGSALHSGADEALLYDTLKEIKKTKLAHKALSNLQNARLLAGMIAAIIGSLIVKIFGIRYCVLFVAVPSFMAFLLSLDLREPYIFRRVQRKNYRMTLKKAIKIFRKNLFVRVLTIDLLVGYLACYYIWWFYQKFLMNFGIDVTWFGIIHSLFYLSEVVFTYLFPHIAWNEETYKIVLNFSLFIVGIGIIVMSIIQIPWIFVLTITVILGSGMARLPLIKKIMNKHIPTSERATIVSITSMFNSLTRMLINPVVGIFVDISLSYFFLGLGSIIVFYFLVSRVKVRDIFL